MPIKVAGSVTKSQHSISSFAGRWVAAIIAYRTTNLHANRQQPQEQQYQQPNHIMLHTLSAENNDDAANLQVNAAFVADNRLAMMDEEGEITPPPQDEQKELHENGKRNIEAETNKPDNNEDYMTENYDGTTNAAVTLLPQSTHEDDDADDENNRRTIESNEEYAAMVNDNLNESSTEDGAIAASMHTNANAEEKLQAAENEEIVKANEKDALQVSGNEQDDLNENYEFVEDTAAHHADDAKEDASDEEAAVVNSSAMHSNYAASAKQREDAASSADESDNDEDGGAAGAIEMNATFNSEWENLAEDLANANDRNNELDNDIDVYEAALPLDLSNDIAVNDFAAVQPDFTPDPDAEFIDVNGDAMRLAHDSMMQPRFEKLTIDDDVMSSAANYQAASVK